MKFAAAPFVDAIRRACLVHQSVRSELDKFPGVEFSNDGAGTFRVRGTDGDITVSVLLDIQDHTEATLIDRPFLMPSDRLYRLFNAPGKWDTIEMEVDENEVHFQMGTVKASLTKVMGDLPPQPSIDPDDMFEANAFGKVVDLVAWARDGHTDGALSGILFSPTAIGATDKLAAALFLGKTGIKEKLVLPAAPLRKVFSGLTDLGDGDIAMGEHAGRIFISPRPHIQYSVMAIDSADKYVPLEEMFRKEPPFDKADHQIIEIPPTKFLAAAQRAESVSGNERATNSTCPSKATR